MKRISWRLGALGLAACGAVGVVILAVWNAEQPKTPHYITAPVSIGAMSRQITASGTVNPVVTVQVGAFVSGNIQALFCDYNTRVSKGQICATIDPRPYQLTMEQDSAALDTAKAQLDKDQADLKYASLTYDRDAALLALDSVSRDAVDNALSARDQAKAQVAVDAATVRQRQASLDGAQVNLGYTKILSPVDGTVVSRNVTVGQTVASSFQTPTLFLIAQDLAKMQVDTNVSEADIAGAAEGAAATFTVDAYPGRVFKGQVAQVRQAPVSVQNVITYDVVIAVDNSDLRLKPGMTATAKIVVAHHNQVLRAPIQALQYSPEATKNPGRSPQPVGGSRRVWVLQGGKPVAKPVTVGLEDDRYAEISGGDLKAGDPVIVSETRQQQKAVRAPAMRLNP
jgi:HlyD family secretion protein